MTENTKKDSPRIDPKIEAIKEIIFGENIKEYEDEFKKITELIRNHKKELEKKLEEFRAEAIAKINDSNKDFSDRLEEISKNTEEGLKELDNAKISRNSLGELLLQMAKSIQD